MEMPENGKTLPGEKRMYKYMFADCKRLLDTPVFKQQVLEDQNYYSMFRGCTALKTLSPLNYMHSYNGNSSCMCMFLGCTALEEVPDGFLSAHVKYPAGYWEL